MQSDNPRVLLCTVLLQVGMELSRYKVSSDCCHPRLHPRACTAGLAKNFEGIQGPVAGIKNLLVHLMVPYYGPLIWNKHAPLIRP